MSFQLPQTSGRYVTVLGAGVLGRRIATCWVSGGYDVYLRDPNTQQLKDAQTYLDENIEIYCDKTKSSPGQLSITSDLAKAVKMAWLVIECVPEKLEIKLSTFAELEKLAPADAILATNSSSYKSSEMLGSLSESTKQRILNQHYMMPPQARVVELMTCTHTDPTIFPFLTEKLAECGMSPFIAKKESSGFIFNRIWAAIKREVVSVISEGVATPDDIDSIWKQQFVNNPVGPCQMMDQVGLDTVVFIEKHYVKERNLPTGNTVDFLEKYFIQEGKLGAKSANGGFYPGKTRVHDQVLNESREVGRPTLYFLDIGLNAHVDPLSSGKILRSDADGHHTKVLVDNLPLPDGLEISEGRIYWTNMGLPPKNDGSVYSCNLNGDDIKVIVPEGSVHTPKQLAIDHANRKIYFCDREGMRVMRVNLDGTNLETIIRTGDFTNPDHQADQLRWCVGIAVDPENGYFYWTQKGTSKGQKGRIFRAPTHKPEAQHSETHEDVEMLFDKLPEPIDLDINNGYLYWTDRGEIPFGNSLNRVSLDELRPGSRPSDHHHQVISRNLHEAIGLKVDTRNSHIFATDLGGTVYRFNLDGSHKVKLIDREAAFTGITIDYT